MRSEKIRQFMGTALSPGAREAILRIGGGHLISLGRSGMNINLDLTELWPGGAIKAASQECSLWSAPD